VDLLQKMLKLDPRERFSLQQILEHSWITNDDLMTPQEWEKQKQLDAKTSE
jgi:serine/threonine protein kinase